MATVSMLLKLILKVSPAHTVKSGSVLESTLLYSITSVRKRPTFIVSAVAIQLSIASLKPSLTTFFDE